MNAFADGFLLAAGATAFLASAALVMAIVIAIVITLKG